MIKQTKPLKTVGDFIQWGEQLFIEAGLFYGHGTDNPWDEAVALVTFAVGETPLADQSITNQPLDQQQISLVQDLFHQRIVKRIPAAYLTGTAWFVGLQFNVNENVLVPRSPIGELIIQQFSPWLRQEPVRILDLCTGSGCIGIACAYAFSYAEVVLSDISADALTVAQQNITLHNMADRVTTVESDLFDALKGQRFDLIVTNPPYVDEADLSTMPDEYHHEPAIGLSSGFDGLDFTRRLLAEVGDHLNPQGVLVCEVGNSWVALDEAYPDTPFNWLEFEQGGHGVFVLDKDDLPTAR